MTLPGPAGLKSWLCTCSAELAILTSATRDSRHACKLRCMLLCMCASCQVLTLCLHSGLETAPVPLHASSDYTTDFVLSLPLSRASVKAIVKGQDNCWLTMLHTLRDGGASAPALLCRTRLDGVLDSSKNSEATSPSLSSFKPFVYQSNPYADCSNCLCHLALA